MMYMLCLSLLVCPCLACDDLVMLMSNGSTIVGRKFFTVLENKPYAAFWRIPYAEAPLHDLRFQPPKKYEVWLNDITYDFSRPNNEMCTSGINEDCLYLSVYMPNHNHTTFPVAVWIHEQSNFHNPDFLLDEDVIVVTVSYRTSILGFLNTGDEFAEGNMGAKDIIMALQWVRDNITLFNGDVNRVTVIGSGSASSIVGSLVLSTAAEDLFTRVIIQSGSALSPADYRNHGFDVLKKLFWKFDGPYNKFNRKKLYEILSTASVDELTAASEELFDSTEIRDNQRLINPFGPTIEVSKHAFMNKSPLEVYKRRMANNNVQVMLGYTTLESLHKLKGFVRNRKLLKNLNYNFQYLLPFEGAPDEYGSKRYRRIAKKIMDFYFVNGTIGERSLRRYARYISDQVIYPLLRQAVLHAQASCSHVYLYRFTFRGSLNVGWDSVRSLNYSATTTGDEICYLFRCKSVNDVYRSAEASNERDFIKKITRLWANFIKYGNPTLGDEDDVLGNLIWKPLNSHHAMRALSLDKKLKMIKVPEEKRKTFWDDLRNEFFPEEADRILRDEL